MSTESILAAFQSAFPSLYQPEPQPDPGAGEQQAADGAQPAAAAAPPPAPASAQAAVAAPAAEASQDAAPLDQYDNHLMAITQRFEGSKQAADSMEDYLKAAKQQAHDSEERALEEADEEFTPAWRHVGLPLKPSHLHLDSSRMADARLVNPKAILGEYNDLKTKEVLLPPRTFEYNDTSVAPHYLNLTSNLETRRRKTLSPEKLARISDHAVKTGQRTWHLLPDEAVKAKIREAEERRRAMSTKMPADQYDLEKKIIRSMHHKLNFLRNPRYQLPPAVKLLQSQFQEGSRWGIPDPKAHAPPVMKANLTSKPDVVFVVEPDDVVFMDYDVGVVYEKKVKVRNVTSIVRSLRLFPPASQYFHTSLPRFPLGENLIAPGMAAEVVVRFCPDSLADYDDEITVDYDTNRFSVPLRGRRPPPALTLANEIHIGEVVLGNRKVQQITFQNRGGQGRFRVIPAAFWPHDYANAPGDIAQIGPFEVWPLFFDLPNGSETTLNFSFEPTAMGVAEERLILVCDNCQVQEFHIRGLGSSVEVEFAGVDGDVMSMADLDCPLWFGEVVPGSGFTKHIAVRNKTTLAFPFKWFESLRPLTFRRREMAQPEPMAKHGDVSLESVRSTEGPDPDAGAEVDLVALGVQQDGLFKITPPEGVLQPGELLEFAVEFLPRACERYERWAQLRVDKSTSTAPAGCTVTVLECGFEGVGAPLGLSLRPGLINIPGMLTPGQQVSRTITLENPSRAPAEYSFTGLSDSVRVEPSQGTVAPLSSASLAVVVTAFEEVGPVEQQMVCHVRHGRPLPLQVTASVGHPHVELVTTRLDFGLVRLMSTAKRQMVIRNSSATAKTPFSLKELFKGSSGEYSEDVEQEGEEEAAPYPSTSPTLSASPVPGLHVPALRTSASISARELRNAQGPSKASHGSSEGRYPASSCNVGGQLQALPSMGRQRTYLTFEPREGWLAPGQELHVEVTCHARSDGQHNSIVQCMSVGGYFECLGAFACVVTPKCVLSKPKIDLGVTFVGCVVKQSLVLRNLSLLPCDFKFSTDSPDPELLADIKIRPDRGTLASGEEVELQVRYNPRAVGQSTVMGICDVEGCPEPTGFCMTSQVKGLDVTYELYSEEAFERYQAQQRDTRTSRRRRDDVENFVGMPNLPPDVLARINTGRQASTANRHMEIDFGRAVPLGESRSAYLVLTNRTAIHTSVRTWLDHFGVEDAARLERRSRMRGRNNPSAPNGTGQPGSASTSARVRISKFTPIRLASDEDKINPFRSQMGRDMMATRRADHDAEQVLGEKGLAVSVSPPESTLEPWSRLVLAVSAFNDMCGDYFDMLHVKVGDLQPRDVPLRVGVCGTPLTIHKDRVLVRGLKDRVWKTAISFGQLPKEVPLQQTFYVTNTGSLDMELSWVFHRCTDEVDVDVPGAQILDVKLVSLEPQPRPLVSRSGTRRRSRTLSMAAAESSMGGALPAGESLVTPQPGADAQEQGSTSTTTQQLAPPAANQPAPSDPSAAQALATGTEADSLAVSSQLPDVVLTPQEPEQPLVRLDISRHFTADGQPFVVEPASQVIKGGACAKFTISFLSSRPVLHTGYLEGRQRVFSPEQPIDLKLWPSGDKGEQVGVLLSGTFHPHAGGPPVPLQPLRIDLRCDCLSSRLEPDANSELDWHCCSTLPADTHPSYRHTITMSNLQTAPMVCKFDSEGPFKVLSAIPSAPQDPNNYRGTSTGTLSGSGWVFVPPRESVDVTLHFLPGKAGEQRDDYQLQGSLRLTYTNGDVQVLPLVGHVSHPSLEVRPAVLDYGPVHVRAPKPLDVVLSNPTLVDATWAVVTGDQKPRFPNPQDAAANAYSEARFGPWVVRPASGILPGRGLKLPRTQKVTVTYAPSDATPSSERLVFAVYKGRPCQLMVSGSGSHIEADEFQEKLYRI